MTRPTFPPAPTKRTEQPAAGIRRPDLRPRFSFHIATRQESDRTARIAGRRAAL